MSADSQEYLPPCCVRAAEADFRARYPLEPDADQDWLRSHLLMLAQKWGAITEASTRGAYFRSVPRQDFFDAQTYLIACPNGHAARIVLLGSRVYYLAWRLNLICSTYWTTSNESSDLISITGDQEWPLDAHLDQLQTAVDVYMDDAFLSNEGFEDLKRFVAEGQPQAGLNQMYIGEFALLFLFLHEMNHALADTLEAHESMQFKVVSETPGLSEKRRKRWSEELSHDANAAFMNWLSAVTVFQEKFGMELEDAKWQAGSLAYTGADLALHTLQFVEEARFGKVAAQEAALMREFRLHPPSQERRDKLSLTAFRAVTGKPLEDLWKRRGGPAWAEVARNVGSQMRIRDRLLTAHFARHAPDEGNDS